MKKIKVYVQYPWRVSDSQYYKSLIENPPEGVYYLPKKQKAGMIINKKKLAINNFLKTKVRVIIEKFNFPILNSHSVERGLDYDLVHFAHCLPKKGFSRPWVADFEDLWQMWISGRDTKTGIRMVRKILLDKNCKKILAWTESARKSILKRYPELRSKIEIVGFGQKVQKFKKIKHAGIRLLFVGRYFYDKGGFHALEAIDRLTKKYPNVDAVFVSQTPLEITDEYSKNKKIKFYELVPHEKLMEELIPSSDILIYPGYSDTFGFIFPEALSFGIPVVTVDGFARRDMIEDGQTGRIIPPREKMIDKKRKVPNLEISEKLVRATSELIENRKLRKKMSKNCLKEVTDGKFSIKKRNEKLREIYLDALA